MKKIAAVIFTITILISCTGCGKSENKSGAEENSASVGIDFESNFESTGGNVKSVLENYDADFEFCQNNKYVNLDWTNTGKCPIRPVSTLYDIDCEATIGIAEIPQKEMLDKFKEYCMYYFGECLDDFAFFDTLETIGDTIPPEVIVGGISYRGYYKICDFREKLENGSIEINWLVYRNIKKNQYLWWGYGKYPHWVSMGATITILDDNIRVSSWLPSDMGEPIERYYNDGKNDDVKYNLANGEMSIGEAIKFFTEEYPKTLPFEDKPEYSVKYVDVYKLTESTYGYLLWITNLHASISFELGSEIATNEFVPDYYTINGQALMVRRNEVDFTLHCEPITNAKELGEPLSNIISLREAADIVSQELSQNVNFNVVSTELVYHGMRNSDNGAHLKPTWQFVLYNENDAMNYNVYVDVVSGECTYFRYSSV